MMIAILRHHGTPLRPKHLNTCSQFKSEVEASGSIRGYRSGREHVSHCPGDYRLNAMLWRQVHFKSDRAKPLRKSPAAAACNSVGIKIGLPCKWVVILGRGDTGNTPPYRYWCRRVGDATYTRAKISNCHNIHCRWIAGKHEWPNLCQILHSRVPARFETIRVASAYAQQLAVLRLPQQHVARIVGIFSERAERLPPHVRLRVLSYRLRKSRMDYQQPEKTKHCRQRASPHSQALLSRGVCCIEVYLTRFQASSTSHPPEP